MDLAKNSGFWTESTTKTVFFALRRALILTQKYRKIKCFYKKIPYFTGFYLYPKLSATIPWTRQTKISWIRQIFFFCRIISPKIQMNNCDTSHMFHLIIRIALIFKEFQIRTSIADIGIIAINHMNTVCRIMKIHIRISGHFIYLFIFCFVRHCPLTSRF